MHWNPENSRFIVHRSLASVNFPQRQRIRSVVGLRAYAGHNSCRSDLNDFWSDWMFCTKFVTEIDPSGTTIVLNSVYSAALSCRAHGICLRRSRYWLCRDKPCGSHSNYLKCKGPTDHGSENPVGLGIDYSRVVRDLTVKILGLPEPDTGNWQWDSMWDSI